MWLLLQADRHRFRIHHTTNTSERSITQSQPATIDQVALAKVEHTVLHDAGQLREG